MKKPTTHMGVKAGIEVLAGRALQGQADQYAKDIAPLLRAVKNAKSEKGLRRSIGASMVKKMGTKALTEAIGQATLQADLIARTEARPMSKEKKGGNGKTSKQ